MSSEEYEPDAWAVTQTGDTVGGLFKAFSRNTFGSDTAANPYHYGHVPEVTVKPDGTASIRKHYCMGRISRELVQVMPDNRTVLMGDDYTIADIALLGWVRNLIVNYGAAELLGIDDFKNVAAWLERGLARPAVQRGLTVPARA